MKFFLKLYLISIIVLVNASYTFIEKTKKDSLFDYSKIYKNLRYLEGEDNTTVPSSTDSSTVPSSTDSSTVPSTTDSSTVPSTTDSSTVPSSTDSSTVPSTTDSSTVPSSTDSSTVPSSTEPSNAGNSTQLLPEKLLIGYDGYTRSSDEIEFFAYVRYFLIPADKFIYILIRITKNLRALEEETRNVTCPLVSQNDDGIAQYKCEEDEISGDISKVDAIGLANEGEPIKESDLSKVMGDNLQNQNGDKISADGMIVLDSCRLSKDSNNNNIITCTIDSYSDSSLNNKGSTLHIVQNDGKVKDVPAELAQNGDNVEIKLDPQYSINSNLNNTIGRINNGGKNLYLVFNGGEKSTLTYTPSGANSNRAKKSSGGLSAGGIVAIIIPCILVLIAVAALTFFLGKRNPTPPNENMANNTIGINSSSNIIK